MEPGEHSLNEKQKILHAHILVDKVDEKRFVGADHASRAILEAVSREHGYRRIVMSDGRELFWLKESFSEAGHDGKSNIAGFDTLASVV